MKLIDHIEVSSVEEPQFSVIWLHGFGADGHDFEAILPELVETREKSGYKAVKYEKLVPLLIEAVKELKQEVDELKSKIK